MITAVTNRTAEEGRDIQWYLYLHDSGYANEIVAKALDTAPNSEDMLRRSVQCSDRRKRDLWIVTFPHVRLIEKASKEFQFKLTVFSAEGGSMPRPWKNPNLARRKKRLQEKVKKGALRA